MNKKMWNVSTTFSTSFVSSENTNHSSAMIAVTKHFTDMSTYGITALADSNETALSHNSSTEHNCLWILYGGVGTSRIRIWDVMLLIPNLLFLMFVLYRMRSVWHRILSGIGSGGSPIFVTYFTLVALAAILGVIRGIVSMTVDVTSLSGSDANKILWVVLRFFLLTAEVSVLVFGLAFGYLESKTSVNGVLILTTCFALVYSIIQCVLELVDSDARFQIVTPERSVYRLYSHGGAMFCFITSIFFFLIYLLVALLPFMTCLQKYFSVPTRKIFYAYVVVMACLYFISMLGCGLLLYRNLIGLCLLDAYSLAYFTMFGPLVYCTFLQPYFNSSQATSMLFSYATQVDEGLQDVADYDFHANGMTVDSTLSGILVFDHGEEPLQNRGTMGKRRGFSETATTDDLSVTSPSSDSTHSFIRSFNAT